jgi:O-succinylbenzoate synthase
VRPAAARGLPKRSVLIDHIELRLLTLPLVRPFETSLGRTDARELILVHVRGEGEAGWGECVADVHPYYSAETTVTAWYVLRDHVAPRVLGVLFSHPSDILPALSQIRGHRMAKAAVEMACWDLFSRQQRQPLGRLLGGVRREIASGVSIGIQGSMEELADRIAEERAAGYRRIKIKVKPGWDEGVVEFVREKFGDALPLMVDANGAYRFEDAERLSRLDRFGLMMIEQPLDDEDVLEHSRLQARLATPVCLDESIVSARRAEEAMALGACRVVNIKPGRLGGHAESIQVHDVCARHKVPVWHGGMLETGIGRMHNVHLASLENFSLPGDIASSRRYFAPDLIEPAVEVSPDGTIPVPDAPGLGVEVVEDRVERATRERLTLTS